MDITTLVAFATVAAIPTAAIYFAFGNLKTDIQNIRAEIQNIRIDIQDMKNEVRSVNLRVARIEGALANKECCMIKPSRELEKAE